MQVLGDSMEPEFPHGVVVVVEPGGVVEDGCYVVAHPGGGEVVLRRLRIDGARWRLSALNESYPDVEIGGPSEIRGRVVQRAGRRRADRKSYL